MASDQFYEGVRCYRCGGDFHDILTRGKNAIVSCVFCGAMDFADWIPPLPEAVPSSSGGFKFKFGSFAGMTIAEVADQPNGEQYLRLQLRQSGKLRPMIEEFFAARDAAKKLDLPECSQGVPLATR